jgi:hypothetical protein
MTRVVVVFLDGVGLGDDDSQVNPLAAALTLIEAPGFIPKPRLKTGVMGMLSCR